MTDKTTLTDLIALSKSTFNSRVGARKEQISKMQGIKLDAVFVSLEEIGKIAIATAEHTAEDLTDANLTALTLNSPEILHFPIKRTDSNVVDWYENHDKERELSGAEVVRISVYCILRGMLHGELIGVMLDQARRVVQAPPKT